MSRIVLTHPMFFHTREYWRTVDWCSWFCFRELNACILKITTLMLELRSHAHVPAYTHLHAIACMQFELHFFSRGSWRRSGCGCPMLSELVQVTSTHPTPVGMRRITYWQMRGGWQNSIWNNPSCTYVHVHESNIMPVLHLCSGASVSPSKASYCRVGLTNICPELSSTGYQYVLPLDRKTGTSDVDFSWSNNVVCTHRYYAA